jgi:hypothetical protein
MSQRSRFLRSRVVAVGALAILLSSLVCLASAVSKPPASSRTALPLREQTARKTALKVPLSFEENHGQVAGSARFLSRGSGYTLALSPTEAVLSLRRERSAVGSRQSAVSSQQPRSAIKAPSPQSAIRDPQSAIRLRLLGGNPRATVTGVEKQRGIVNYLIGNDAKKWKTRVPTFAKVKYDGVYPGVDLVYHGNQGSLEYDFIVAPGADPKQIRFSAEGADEVELTPSGDLLLHTPTGTLTQKKPIAYQLIDGEKYEVPASFSVHPTPYTLHPSAEVAFRVAHYDATRPLIIDPVLGFSTYFGGSGDDLVSAVAVDSAGCVYLAGGANSPSLPSAPGYAGSNAGWYDAVAAKLTADGLPIYVTFLGGAGLDLARSIAVDTAGCAHLTGETSSSNFPLDADPLQADFGGQADAFLTTLSADGASLVTSTYLGGSDVDRGTGIALDASENVYLAGTTTSDDYPTENARDATLDTATACFVTKIAAGGAMAYSTYLEGFDSWADTSAAGIAVRPSGEAAVVGTTNDTQFPTVHPVQNLLTNAPGGAADVFVTSLAADGQSLVFSTYLGGDSHDWAGGVALGADGAVYVTGGTYSPNFPVLITVGTPLFAYPSDAGVNGFVTKLDSNGAWNYSTYLPGHNGEQGSGITVRPSGEACVVGETSSFDFPTRFPLQDWTGTVDAFLTCISPLGNAVTCSTYLGGAGADHAYGIALADSARVVVAGQTSSTDFPLTAGVVADPLGQQGEGFVTRVDFRLNPPETLTVTENADHRPVLSWNDPGDDETGFRLERKPREASDTFYDTVLDTTSHTDVVDTTTQLGREYTYRVRCFDSASVGGASDPAEFEIAPPATPDGLTAEFDVTGTEVHLTWVDNGATELGFELRRRTPATDWEQVAQPARNATQATDTTVTPGGLYYYSIRAQNEGGASGWSAETLAGPLAPVGLTATARSTSRVSLSWSGGLVAPGTYEIEARRGAGDFARIAAVGADITEYQDANLAPGTTFTYRVRAIARQGTASVASAWSDPATATTDALDTGAPAAPGNLAAFSPDRGRVLLTWMDNSGSETGFRVFRRIGAGPYSPIADLPTGANSYADTTTTGDTSYAYAVAAFNSSGVSPSTRERSVTTMWGPENLTASAVTTAQVNLSWKDMSLYEDGYSIERQKAGGTMLEVARVSGKVGKNQTLTYTDTGLTSGVVYTYRIRAYNANAASLYATGTSITTAGAPQPGLRVTPVAKSYGRVPKGQARTATFTVWNTGKKWEAVTIPALGGAFQVLGSRHFTLRAGASRSFKVRFTGGKVGSYQAELPVKCQHGECVKLKLEGRSVRS